MLLVSNNYLEGKKLASRLKIRFCLVGEKRFPDSEKTLLANMKQKADVIYFQFNNNDSFDDQLFNLLCIVNAHGNRRKTKLVLPYLPYLRSYPFSPNEIDKVSYILDDVTPKVRKFYIVNPHKKTVSIGRPIQKRVILLNIDNQIARFLKRFGPDRILVSPDHGFLEHVKRLAQISDSGYIGLSKKRISPEKIVIKKNHLNALKIASSKHKSFIIVDDIISTGNTLLGAAEYLKSLGVNKINCFVIHDTRRKPPKRKLNVYCSNSLVGKYTNTKPMLDISPVIYSVLKQENLSSKARRI